MILLMLDMTVEILKYENNMIEIQEDWLDNSITWYIFDCKVHSILLDMINSSQQRLYSKPNTVIDKKSSQNLRQTDWD